MINGIPKNERFAELPNANIGNISTNNMKHVNIIYQVLILNFLTNFNTHYYTIFNNLISFF